VKTLRCEGSSSEKVNGDVKPYSLTHSLIHSIVSYDGIYNFGGTGGKSNVFNNAGWGKVSSMDLETGSELLIRTA